MSRLLSIVSAALLLTLAGCPREPDHGGMPEFDGPGSEAWGSEDIGCSAPDDCLTGEVCLNGVCQVDRCNGGLQESVSPLGESLTFFQENEIGIADAEPYEGNFYVDGYGPLTGTLDYDGSWDLGGGTVLDIAGGNLNGSRPESYVVAVSGHRSVGILIGDNVIWKDLDFYPVAVDAGDTDGDGLDEVIAISSAGETAICDYGFWSCSVWEFSGNVEQLDVAAGDVDGDAVEEVVVLLDYEGYRYLYAMNIDAEVSGQPDNYQAGVDGGHVAVAAGDIDSDYVAEVVVLLDGGWFGWWDDSIAAYETSISDEGGNLVQSFSAEIDGYAGMVDLDVADTDADEKAEIVIVSDDGYAAVYRTSGLNFVPKYITQLDVTVSPKRIAMADHDGNSPRAELVEGPIPCQGAPVPINILIMPPYNADHAAGFPSSVMYGDVESSSENMRDTVSLGLHVDLGVGGSFFDIFGAELNSRVSWTVRNSVTTGESMFVGARYCMRAYPEVYGQYYAGVVLSWGCFDSYRYKVDDPGHIIGSGAQGGEFYLIVPTGGASSLFSSNRYNAMAEAIGGMPLVDVPYAVGTVETYPTTPETLAGDPIPAENNLFPHPDVYTVSDVGETVWWMGVQNSTTTETAMDVSVGASANVKVGGVKIGGGGELGWGEAYSLTVGTEATFAGSIPTLQDNPNTPEDEYDIYSYSVSPYVYVQHYETAEGDDGAYYVQTYTQTSH